MKTDSDRLRGYIDRVASLRKRRGLTQDEMAGALGIPMERSPLPVELLERFCAIVGADIEYVVTGRASRRRGPSPIKE